MTSNVSSPNKPSTSIFLFLDTKYSCKSLIAPAFCPVYPASINNNLAASGLTVSNRLRFLNLLGLPSATF